jgi:sec-independent protein translocase protein TatB
MNILGMGPMELLLIVVLALIVFGPARLPEIMGQVGKAIADFRRVTSDLSDEFNRTIQSELQETKALVDDARSTLTDAKAAVTDVHSSVSAVVTGAGLPAPIRTAAPPPPVTNGVSAEPHAASSTNGTVPAQATPMADKAQWSWEVAAPAPKPVADETADAAQKVEPSPPSTHGYVPHDELQPPY